MAGPHPQPHIGRGASTTVATTPVLTAQAGLNACSAMLGSLPLNHDGGTPAVRRMSPWTRAQSPSTMPLTSLTKVDTTASLLKAPCCCLAAHRTTQMLRSMVRRSTVHRPVRPVDGRHPAKLSARSTVGRKGTAGAEGSMRAHSPTSHFKAFLPTPHSIYI
jgi:hypothetical protein